MFGKKEQNYDFLEKLSRSNEYMVCAGEVLQSDEYLSLKNGVFFSGDSSIVIENAKKDFINFLHTSCDMDLPENKKGVEIILNITQALQEVSGYKARIVNVQRDKIIINAYDERGASCALFDVEELMLNEKAPMCKIGVYKRKPLFSPRMVHSFFEHGYYTEGYMLKLLKEGIDAVVWIIKSTDIDTDLDAKMKKATELGLDSYAYSLLENFTHPSDEGAEKIYQNIYGKIFRNYKELKGIILVGESVEFASKDDRVDCRHYYEKDENNLPGRKLSPGWFPCKDYPEWLELVKKSVRKVKADADIVFWTYNWGWAPEKERVDLLNTLPTDITLLVTFEMFEKYKICGITEQVCDYSIVRPKAGSYFISEAKIAKERGIKLYAMSNTGGRTWDSGAMPCLPFPYKWKERIDAVNDCREKYQISGLMECHDYGYYPSFITRLAKYCFEQGGNFTDENSSDKSLLLIFKNYFGVSDENVQKAFKLVSRAMDYFPPTDEMQYGPMRMGPAYPLNLKEDCTPPKRSKRETHQICITDFDAMDNIRCGFTPYSIRVWTEIKMLKRAIKMMNNGVTELKNSRVITDNLKEVINMLEFFICSLKTARNVSKFYVLKNRLKIEKNKSKCYKIISKIKKIGLEEIENARNCIKFVELDSRLGYNVDMDYVCDKQGLEWKIKQVEYMLEAELQVYINCLKNK